MRTVVTILCALLLLSLTAQRAGSHGADEMGGAHMYMTALRPPAAADAERAQVILAALRPVMDHFRDVRVAQAEGFQQFLPNVPQKSYHFTNWAYAREAWFGTFNPAHPTSLMYDKTSAGFHLSGAMYTAPPRYTEEQLNMLVPLSIGTWHKHVNFCFPQKGQERLMRTTNPLFGMAGSINTKDQCDAAGGRFVPLLFGWMLHVWPDERDPQEIWGMHHDDAAGANGVHHHHDMVASGGNPFTGGLPIPADKLPAMSVGAGNALGGAQVFANSCAGCHGSNGRNGPDAPALAASGLRAGQVAFMVRNPQAVDPRSEMPRLPLSDRELADVAAYVEGLK